MDSLTHLVLNFSAGYIFLKGIRADFRIWHLFILAFISQSLDMDHVFEYNRIEPFFDSIFKNTVSPMHNIFFITFISGGIYFAGKYLKNNKIQIYSLALFFMFFGNIVMDTVSGMYGVPLFFPLTNKLVQIPPYWHFISVGHSYVIQPMGIALLVYFSVVFAGVWGYNFLKKK